MTEYWSWWQGGLALGGLTILFRLVLHRPLGVSGSWLRVASTRQEFAAEQQANGFTNDTNAVSSALMEATLAQFGEEALHKLSGTQPENKTVQAINPVTTSATIGQHAVFLLFIFVGGLLMALYTGRFSIDLELSKMLTSLSRGLAASWVHLLFGGMMVGFGTQMAAGCTSGHGLSGCAQGSRASMLATAIFFGGAVIMATFMSLAVKS